MAKTIKYNISYSEAQRNAVAIVGFMVKTGELKKLDGTVKCADCNKPARQYDHRYYSKPTVVEPVCRSCNMKRGNTLDKHLYTHDTLTISVKSFKAVALWKKFLYMGGVKGMKAHEVLLEAIELWINNEEAKANTLKRESVSRKRFQ